MTTEYRLPELGEDIESGDVVSVLVSAGDRVEENQTVMEIETDKATIEIPAPVSGLVSAIHVKAGDKVKVGALLITIDDGAASPQTAAASDKPVSESKPEKSAEKPKTQPAPESAKSPESDAIQHKPTQIREDAKATSVKSDTHSAEPAPASPGVRRLARELGADVARIPGTGTGGRISEEDVKNYVRRAMGNISTENADNAEPPPTPAPSNLPQRELPDFSKWGEIEREPMSNIRRIISDVMTQSWTTAPHVTQHDKADITKLDALRKNFAQTVEASGGGKLTITAILIKITAAALHAFPKFAASIDLARGEIIYKKYRHIGVAVDTERGLFVPVIRDADEKNISEISAELAMLTDRARNKKITFEELRGGVFTISNQGSLGGEFFSPVIYTPEVAILGVSRARIEPRFVDGEFQPRLMLPLSLSHDHRVIDGADAVRFMNWIIGALEEPFKLLVEG